MQLIITNKFKDSADNFVYNYLPNLIYNLVKGELNITRLKEFDEYTNINYREVILYACRNLSITKPSKNVYNISINKNLKYKGKSISSWIKFITYGNRDIKGYPVVLNIFRKIKDNISYIYREYKLKWPYDITTKR